MDSPIAGQAVDLDRDGDLDLLVATRGPAGGVSVFSQSGPGLFQPDGKLPLLAGGGRDVAAADLDGDGYPDVIAAGSDRLALFEGPLVGAMPLNPDQALDEGACPVAVAVGRSQRRRSRRSGLGQPRRHQ